MNKIIRDSISEVVQKALTKLKNKGRLPFETMPDVRVDPTKDSKFGDVATNVALVLAKQVKMSASSVAQLIVSALQEGEGESASIFKKVEVGGPGFINFFMGRDPLAAVLSDIIKSDERYGSSDFGRGKKVLAEFVSANPTGPLTIAHGRQSAVGDSLARIMKFLGYDVTKEYYLNDRGRQMNILGASVYLRYCELLGQKIQFPEDHYQGEYIRDLAQEVIEKYGDQFLKKDEKEAIEFFRPYACGRIMGDIRRDLSDFDVSFDHYFSELEFVSTGQVEKCLDQLKQMGFLYEQDGALWFKSTEFGDDKDRVLIKSTGEMTYITPDAAYHQNKLERGYDLLINIWGPDHHGYVPRLKAALSALGFDPERLHVIILQLATLFEGDKKLSMSTRRGEFITLRQIIDEVGKDAGRYFFLMRRTDSHLDFDLELAKKQSLENPVYYIQYAHARICSIFEKYRQEKNGTDVSEVFLKDLETIESEEAELIKSLGLFQEILEHCSEQFDPYSLTDYLLKTAQSFHHYYNQHRVLSDDARTSRGRLALVKAVQIVLRNGLGLLGVSAPQSM